MPLSLPIVETVAKSTLPQVETPENPRGKYAFVSLGCPKNLVDSERMLGLLQRDGFHLVEDPEESDFVVINTCGFIDHARKESLQAIDEMLALKGRADPRCDCLGLFGRTRAGGTA